MDFRWISLIALWTLISGPILSGPSGSAASKAKPTSVAKAESRR